MKALLKRIETKAKTHSTELLKKSLVELMEKRNEGGREENMVFIAICNVLEERMGEDAFWAWADEVGI